MVIGIALSKKNQSLTIKSLTIEDPTVYRIVSSIDKENRADFIKRAISIGVIGLHNMSIAENVDYVQKEFSQVLHKLELQREFIDRKMNEIFNVDDSSSPLGELVSLLANYFDTDRGVVSSLLDHNNPNSPLHELREDLVTKLEQLGKDLAVRQKEDEMISVTTLKGGEFENHVESELVRITNSYGDDIERVGDVRGKRGKIGDFVIRVDGDERKSIVIECKDSSAYTHRKVTNEIEAAMDNRKATFGIFLFKTPDQVPKAMRPVRITKNTITTCFDENGLYYAYRVARMFLETESAAKKEGISIESIQEQLATISEKCAIIDGMYRKVTQIENAANYIREGLEEVQEGIEDCLDQIQHCLQV